MPAVGCHHFSMSHENPIGVLHETSPRKHHGFRVNPGNVEIGTSLYTFERVTAFCLFVSSHQCSRATLTIAKISLGSTFNFGNTPCHSPRTSSRLFGPKSPNLFGQTLSSACFRAKKHIRTVFGADLPAFFPIFQRILASIFLDFLVHERTHYTLYTPVLGLPWRTKALAILAPASSVDPWV